MKPDDISITIVETIESHQVAVPDEGELCQQCKKSLTPNRIYEPTSLTWFVCGGICIVGCWFGICLAPLFINSFKVATVYCSSCSSVISKAEYI